MKLNDRQRVADIERELYARHMASDGIARSMTALSGLLGFFANELGVSREKFLDTMATAYDAGHLEPEGEA
jgi:hypothetical protein